MNLEAPMTTSLLDSAPLTEAQFLEISALVKGLCGINLHDGKKELVKARLAKRLRALHMAGYEEYIAHVRAEGNGPELVAMLDALSTNLTHFFREADHFRYLADVLVPRAQAAAAGTRPRLRLWSAGCSTGEEPYSLAVTLAEAIGNLAAWDIAVLATDLSTRVLAQAGEGVYDAQRLAALPHGALAKYFAPVTSGRAPQYQVRPVLRSLIHFGRLNLMEAWPMRGPFDIIFCRNVMIYFDKETQAALVERFRKILAPGGTLCIGHSESLAGVRHQFRYVQPTVYEKA